MMLSKLLVKKSTEFFYRFSSSTKLLFKTLLNGIYYTQDYGINNIPLTSKRKIQQWNNVMNIQALWHLPFGFSIIYKRTQTVFISLLLYYPSEKQ